MTATSLALVLVSMLSFSATAPKDNECSQLTRPLAAQQVNQILGRWIFIEGTINNKSFGYWLDGVKSMWMVLKRTADNQTLQMEQANRLTAQHQPMPMEERCLQIAMNVTLVSGNDLQFHIPIAETYHKFLHTCSDCLLMLTYNKQNDFQMLLLFGRDTTVAASDLTIFRRRAGCLQFLLPSKFQYDTSNELCPE